jgi:RimJ/RimL family protein N-acetyltransferase
MDKFKQRPLVIPGEKVCLRSIGKKDLENLRRWRNANRRYFFNAVFITSEMQQNWFKGYQQKENDLIFIIETLEGKPVGTISLCHIKTAEKEGELGRMLIGDPESRHHGFGYDAARALIVWGFSTLGLEKIVLKVWGDNQPAIKLYEKLGFKKMAVEGDKLKFSLNKL